MKTFALKTRKGSVVKMMSSKSAKQQKALEQGLGVASWGGGRIGEEGREELRRRTEALSDLVEDPNSSVLGDPAAVAVLRAPTTEPGPSRPTRQVFKCPVAGCPITRMTEAAISVHFENAHE